ncbi:cytochrome P450 [Streptomyces tendae]|uniref:cytochrome P450 n=1 Tax=Streptomyces tendae TaxID=1932 RepID=UPI00136CD965|nr:cytochrome P450 [Streptomyces sp. SID5914]MZG16123.1 cytochrome P450 [Streptomyces sp. SID5914]
MSGATRRTPVMFNPLSDGFMEDPHPHYAEIRRHAPVHEHPGGFWVVSRYEDVEALLRADHSVDKRNARGADDARRSPRLKGLALIDQDPPHHTRLRRLVSQAFTPRAMSGIEPVVRDLVDKALDGLDSAGGGDLVETLAFPLPFAVITRILGMPPVDTVRLRELTSLLIRLGEPGAGAEADVEAADAEMVDLVSDAISRKRQNRADDLLTALIDAEDDGDRLSHDELVAQVAMLYVAGYETTVNLISGGTLALLRHPDQLGLLRATPGLDRNAVEELLRYEPPVHLARRVTLDAQPLGDHEIPAGSVVLASLAGANRDEEFWGPDADRLRLDRENARRHVSFGGGAHYCIGGALARIQARIAIGELVRRFPGLEQADEVRWNGLLSLRGPARLEVRL